MSHSYNPYTAQYPNYHPDLSISTHAPNPPNDIDFSQSTWDALNGNSSWNEYSDGSFGNLEDINWPASSSTQEPFFDFDSYAIELLDVKNTVNESAPAPVSTPINGTFPPFPTEGIHAPSFPGGVAGPGLPSYPIHNSHPIYDSAPTIYDNNANILFNSPVYDAGYTGRNTPNFAGGSRMTLENIHNVPIHRYTAHNSAAATYQFNPPSFTSPLYETHHSSGNTMSYPIEGRMSMANIHNGSTFSTHDTAAPIHHNNPHVPAPAEPTGYPTQHESLYSGAGGGPLEDTENVPKTLPRNPKKIVRRRKAAVQVKRIRSRKGDLPTDMHICCVQTERNSAVTICWEEFEDKFSLAKHIKNCHSDGNNKDSKGARTYACPWISNDSGEACSSNSMKGSGSMLRHLLEVHANLLRKECKLV